MTHPERISELKARIAKAEADRDLWRAAGREENYLAAYFMIEALDLQLDEALKPAGR
jgi:hypothetical protein